MKRIVTKVGDVFSAKLDDRTKKYFQLVAFDLTQLNSDVIRVFKTIYPIEAEPDLAHVAQDEVQFYAHCVTKWGIKMNLWEKVGKFADVGKVDVLFRDTNDYGARPGEQVKVSDKWYVWKVNDKEFKRVGRLEGEDQNAEIGVVVNPASVVFRMRTGKYDFVYPGFG